MDETAPASSAKEGANVAAMVRGRGMAALGIALLTLVLLQGIVLVSYLAGLALMLPSWASSVAGCVRQVLQIDGAGMAVLVLGLV